jgi:hypothetical protein
MFGFAKKSYFTKTKAAPKRARKNNFVCLLKSIEILVGARLEEACLKKKKILSAHLHPIFEVKRGFVDP